MGEWEFSIALGLGVRTNPIFSSDDIPIYLIPGVSYYGERFFVNDTSLGYTLFEDESHTLSLISTLSFDQVYFDRWNIRNFTLGNEGISIDNSPVAAPDDDELDGAGGGDADGERNDDEIIFDIDQIDSRNMALLAGVEYYYYSESWFYNVQGLQDISSVHNGNEYRFSATYPFQHETNLFEFTVGAVWQDESIVDYYYGLDENEVPDERLIYQASSTLSPILKFDYKRRINTHWSLYFFLHNKWFGEEIVDSPLVDKKTSTTVFFGGVYHF